MRKAWPLAGQSKVNRLIWLLLFTGGLAWPGYGGMESSRRGEVEQGFAAWKTWLRQYPGRKAITRCPEYQELVKLGPSAVPAMVEIVRADPEGYYLYYALLEITGRYFPGRNENRGDLKRNAKRYVSWWDEERPAVAGEFGRLFHRWKKCRPDERRKAAGLLFEIQSLGLDVLPWLVAEAGAGQPELERIINALTRGDLAAARELKPLSCQEWWENNRHRFSLPAAPGRH